MKRSVKVPRAQIVKSLMDQLKTRTEKYLTKKARFDDELAKDHELLNAAYGSEIVSMILSNNGLTFRKNRSNTDTSNGVSGGNGAKNRGASQRKNPSMSITDLRPHVFEAIKSLDGKEFIRTEIDNILKAKGIVFDHTYVSFILRHTDGINQTEQRKVEGKGRPMNVYKATTGWNPQVKTS